ncbi:hypothetical protein CYFUS_007527 [Cystobacter fuscus]|uniref:Lipoprotein n=1 Tax=Cystobacter fuscus TaxID=43 RepID=A0A250JF60_9BACT|nr:hypothetical protein [Cystobacter fuscus]ATB42051.1 hypothetical protein CYFUS_007527 [Cystobacter fuscus]
MGRLVTTLHRPLSVSLLLLLWSAAPALAREPRTSRAPEPLLSLLEPAGEGCEWVRLQPLSAVRQVIARLAVDCQGGATALSRDGKRGAARFWRGGVSAPVTGRPTFPERFPSPAFRDRLFLVDVETAAATELPLPGSGELIEFGFDAEGQLLGLTLQKPSPEQERQGEAEIDGTRVVLETSEGKRPLLAHAFQWRDGAWKRREVKATTDTTGPRVLALRQKLGERSSHTLDPRFMPEELEDDVVLDQLYAFSPEEPEGEWTLLRPGGFRLAVWSIPFGEEEALATGLVRKVDKQKVSALPGFPLRPNDLASVQIRGTFLLLSLADSGAHPYLYRGGKLVWNSESARAVTFWPSHPGR